MSERCCGTCALFEQITKYNMPPIGECQFEVSEPIPHRGYTPVITYQRHGFATDGTECQCWTPKEPTQEGKP